MEVRKAYLDDFAQVYPLLADHDPKLGREVWRRLFAPPWPAPLEHCGYMLLDGPRCVGFMGTIFAKRRLEGQEYNCCNISSWVVLEGYRNWSLSLLFPVLKLRDWIITNLTPNSNVCQILQNLGFQQLDRGFKLFLPLFQKRSQKCRILQGPADVAAYLDPVEHQIFTDHSSLDCLQLLVLGPAGSSYLVATRLVKKKVPLARLDYIGNPNILQGNLGNVVNFLALRWRVAAVMVDDRFLPGDCRRALSFRFKQPRLYKGLLHNRRLLDNLYSELVMLRI